MMSTTILSLALSAGFATSCASASSPNSPATGTLAGQTSFAKSIGWSGALDGPGIPDGQSADGYEVGRDTSVSHSGHASGFIRSTSDVKQGWRSLTQGIRANAYRGKRVRLSGYLKIKNVYGLAGFWMRVDGIDHQAQFDTMANHPLNGTKEWKAYSLVLDVPEDAATIMFGAVLAGTGQVWIDDLSLTPVDPAKVAATGYWLGPNYSENPKAPLNMDFSASPKTATRLDVPDWITNTGKWGDNVHFDRQVTYHGMPAASVSKVAGDNFNPALFQQILASPYRGKRVQFLAYIKAPQKISGGSMLAIPGGGQWAVADISDLVEKGTKWVKDQREWRPVAAVVDVPMWANCIQLGVELHEVGQIWVSNTSFKVVDAKTPVTYCPPIPRIYSEKDLNKMPLAPVNLDFER